MALTGARVVITPAAGESGRRDPNVRALTVAIREALEAADPRAILSRTLRLSADTLRVRDHVFDLSRFDRVLVIGGGKATAMMAYELERVLRDRLTSGVVNIPDYQRPRPSCERIVLNGASHPDPDTRGVRGVRMMLDLVGTPRERDLVICLISGGGSALMPLPVRGVTLGDVRLLTSLLLKNGVEIAEINAIRKHLSAIGGGRLAEKLYPATVLSLIISDVVGDQIDAIASGPTSPDPTTFADAIDVLKRHDIWIRTPHRVRLALQRGTTGDTPKEGSNAFDRVHNVLIASNRLSCVAAAGALRRMGYARTLVLTTRVQGEARVVGRLFGGILVDISKNRLPFAPPCCVVAGGETTVTVRGTGSGGRNQELALAAGVEIAGLSPPGAYVASFGSDGVDGPTRAAGAMADSRLVERARKAGLDPKSFLRANDSNSFFRRLGGLVVTGPTGTNVNDIVIGVVPEQG